MDKELNMISGGRLGDFVHQLYIPAIIYKENGIKTNLYMAEVGDIFSFGLHNTFNEIKEIILKQPYINKFQIYAGENIDVNLSQWRAGHIGYCWTERLMGCYFGNYSPTVKNFQIIDNIDKIECFKDSLIINRSLERGRHGNKDVYIKNIENYKKEKRYFLYTDINQYNAFPHKNLVQPICVKNIKNMFEIINSCSLFIGNLSAPMAVAYSLMKNIICEIGPMDWISYKDEIKYYSNIITGDFK